MSSVNTLNLISFLCPSASAPVPLFSHPKVMFPIVCSQCFHTHFPPHVLYVYIYLRLCVLVFAPTALCLSVCLCVSPSVPMSCSSCLSVTLSPSLSLSVKTPQTLLLPKPAFLPGFLPTAEKVSDSTICTVWKRLMWILSTYVTSKGEGREGGERRGEQTMNRDKEKAGERESEYRRIY